MSTTTTSVLVAGAAVLLAGCGGGEGPATAADSGAVATTVPVTPTTPAVQGCSDAFLDDDPVTAYGYFTDRCQERVSLSYFTGIVTAAAQSYGPARPVTSYTAEVSGDLARVTYTYDVRELNQTSEPWARESGQWRQDDC